MYSRYTLSALALLGLKTLSHADIRYDVRVLPEDKMQVTVTIPVKSSTTTVQIPNWGPGSYRLVDNWKRMDNIRALNDSGAEITTTKPNDYTWTIPTMGVKNLRFTYTEPLTVTDEIAHYSGPANYIYVVDRKEEPCWLDLDMPANWKVATGLLEKDKGYWADNYYTFADNPVTLGMYRELSYTVLGKKHIMALYGPARSDLDVDKLTKACSFISQMENDFFGNKIPYDHYVWHFNVGKRADGGGGLEHLSSTEITLANGLGDGVIGVNAHEFFHLWNVKRIRSRVLGPFDYTKLPETGALWWLEGVTDYYAHHLMSRYGYWDDKKFYATLLSQVSTVRANVARNEVSPYEASFRVKDAADGRGNSNGYKISYYNLGFILGFMLDVELLSRTNGKHSLDDVEHALWDMTKNDQPGFEEGEIRKQLIRFGGPEMGDLYDQWVMKPGELPVEASLAKIGLQLGNVDREVVDLGIVATPGLRNGFVVNKVSGSATGIVMVDDIVLEVNGSAITTAGSYNGAIRNLKKGDKVTLKIKRGEETSTVELVAGTTNRPSLAVSEIPGANADALKLRELYLFRGKKGWKPKG